MLHYVTIFIHFSTFFYKPVALHLQTRYGTGMESSPPLLGGTDLPGPLCLNVLHSLGTLCKLDNENAYTYHDSRTLYGRASIISTLLPSRSVACAGTAAWVWLGGLFPETIDIIAKAHCRAQRSAPTIACRSCVRPRTFATHHGRAIFFGRLKENYENYVQITAIPSKNTKSTACSAQ